MDFEAIDRTYHSVTTPGGMSSGVVRVKGEAIQNEARIYSQSLRHNVWLEELDIIRDKFPNENALIQDYRNKNKRQFTREVPRKIMQGIVSILSNIPIEVISKNEKFNTWLNSNPFVHGVDRLNFVSWTLSRLIPNALIDPNAILWAKPTYINEFEPVQITPIIIPHDMRYIDADGKYAIIIDGKNYYILTESEVWFAETGDKTSFELVYAHNIGELPFVMLPGLYSFDAKTRKQYNESIIAATYEYLDEALVSFTTDQAVRVKMNSILVRPGLRCGAGCDGGVVRNQTGQMVTCSSCNGSGLAKRPSDLDDFVVPPADTIQGDGRITVEPKYINPDTGVAEFHSRTWKEYLQEAKRSVGIDALIDRSESGEAMKKRLSSFEDFMSYLLYITYSGTMAKYFEIVHKHLNISPNDWIDFPRISVPRRIEIKTPEILRDAFISAVGAERIQAALDYYAALYMDNEIMSRAMRLVVENYPSAIEPVEQIETFILTGIYTREEVARGRRALVVIKRLLQDPRASELDDETILEAAMVELARIVPDALTVINEPGEDN